MCKVTGVENVVTHNNILLMFLKLMLSIDLFKISKWIMLSYFNKLPSHNAASKYGTAIVKIEFSLEVQLIWGHSAKNEAIHRIY